MFVKTVKTIDGRIKHETHGIFKLCVVVYDERGNFCQDNWKERNLSLHAISNSNRFKRSMS